jgi:4-diphosphocytidyl-2-C-methyl-D-erythritol kinase
LEKISVKAPAKINLYLNVLGKRDDGYHEIETLMQAVSLYDNIHLEKSDKIELTCSDPLLPADKSNLVFTAAKTLQDRFSFPGAKIELEKNIPMGAGLGGGSSDAAFVLRGLCQLYDLHPTVSELSDIAASIGSDVPFFLTSGQAIARGRGEIIEMVNLPLEYEIIILSPPTGISTVEAYRSLKINLTTKRMEPLLNGEIDLSGLMRLANDFRNDLEKVALAKYPNLLELKRSLLGTGAFYSAMTGSGSSFFGLFISEGEKSQKLENLEERGIRFFRCTPIRLSLALGEG